jgi:type II secretory pathway pseudopilin PulG
MPSMSVCIKPCMLSCHARRGGTTQLGMTLIELMISVGIIILGLTAAFEAMFSAQRHSQRTQHESLAHEAIRAQIEFYQYLPFITLRNNFKGATFDVAGILDAASYADMPTGKSWPGDRPVPIGTVTRTSNPHVNDTSLVVNRFDNTASTLPLTFTVRWRDHSGDCQVRVDYVFTHRGK